MAGVTLRFIDSELILQSSISHIISYSCLIQEHKSIAVWGFGMIIGYRKKAEASGVEGTVRSWQIESQFNDKAKY